MNTHLINPIMVIYHGHCPDGFAAALAAQLFFKQDTNYKAFKEHIEFYKGKHGSAAPNCTGMDVYIVDFCYPLNELKKLCQQALSVTVLDHHISAYKDVKGLDQQYDNLQLHFDMEQSGAMISWKFFHKTPAPQLFKHIQDNDLWRFEYNHTKTIIKALMSYPMKFKLWTRWLEDEKNSLKLLHQEGAILERQANRHIKNYKRAARLGRIAGYIVPIVNAPAHIGSELLHQLSNGYPFAASYEDKPDRRSWQLRSSGKKAIDVSVVAQKFGGGGHKHASGFSTDITTIDLTNKKQN